MRFKISNIIVLVLIIVLITPTFSLLMGGEFSRTYAKRIENEEAAGGLLISGLLVLLLERVMDGSSGVPDYKRLNKKRSDREYWLAKAIHAEARGEPFKGQVAVGAVILNRVENNEFPDTIYSVIYQKGQFSSVKDGQIKMKPNKQSYRAANQALNGRDPSQEALYFYNPVTAKTLWWLTTREKTLQIGNHVFAR